MIVPSMGQIDLKIIHIQQEYLMPYKCKLFVLIEMI